MALKTSYRDDMFNSSYKKYRQINNPDGTVSFEDMTDYYQKGDTFGGADINNTNREVNNHATSLNSMNGEINSLKQKVLNIENAQYGTEINNLKRNKVNNAKGVMNVWTGSQYEYDQIYYKDVNTLYFVKEE